MYPKSVVRMDEFDIERTPLKGKYVEELADLKKCPSSERLFPEKAEALRRVLYGVYALTLVHFTKEEEVYLPILDERMTAEETREMYA